MAAQSNRPPLHKLTPLHTYTYMGDGSHRTPSLTINIQPLYKSEAESKRCASSSTLGLEQTGWLPWLTSTLGLILDGVSETLNPQYMRDDGFILGYAGHRRLTIDGGSSCSPYFLYSNNKSGSSSSLQVQEQDVDGSGLLCLLHFKSVLWFHSKA